MRRDLLAWPGAPLALSSAALFGASTPFAKLLLGGGLDPWLLAGLLYLGSGIGLAVVRLWRRARGGASAEAPLGRSDLPWLALVVLSGGAVGPILLMVGLNATPAATASLLLNLEALATLGLAWVMFHENVDRRLLAGAAAILAGAAILAWHGGPQGLGWGGLAIAGACLAWGIDNNLTRKIPAAYVRGRAAVTNTVPTTPYRSAGRPEVMFVIERLVDLAADRLGLDPVELRRRNLIPTAAQPYANPLGLTYDSGDYEGAMDMALALADWAGYPARCEASRRRGRRRGIGIANYVEITSGAPRERAEVTVSPAGRVELVIGTMSSGQGHETSFAQLVAEWLGVPFEAIDYVAHDTARVAAGGGSHSGRSMKLAVSVIGQAADDIVAKGREIAAHLFEASVTDIEFAGGRFRVAGTDREIGLFEVAAAASRSDLPPALQGPLAAVSDQVLPVASFPYGTQICEVEVDPETGVVEIVRYAAVDDVGRAVNPLILHGQTHGGIAQGVGQALFEDCHYDPATGQLLAASFMDYAMPRADGLPAFVTALSEVPSPTNRLGVRSGGEGGTTPALAVVINAIVDALSEFGVEHIEMPATPERIWRAIQAAKAQNS